MFWARAISFPLLLAIFFAMIFWRHGGWIFTVIVPFLLGMAGYEFGNILQKLEMKCAPKVISAVMFLFGIAFVLSDKSGCIPVSALLCVTVPFFAVFLTFAGLLFMKDRKNYFLKRFTEFGSIIFLIILYCPLLAAYFEAKNFLFLVLVTKMTDTGGYIFGKLSSYLPWGNHKIAPKFSPNKSYEGLFGGMLMSVAAGLILLKYGCSPFSLNMTVVSSVVLSLGSFAGDLTESALKREAEIKDSGNWIPGMGGIFDVLDSFIYNGIIFMVLQFCCR